MSNFFKVFGVLKKLYRVRERPELYFIELRSTADVVFTNWLSFHWNRSSVSKSELWLESLQQEVMVIQSTFS